MTRNSASDAVYFEPPVAIPMWQWSDTDLLAWLDHQSPAYQETVRAFAVSAGVPVADLERRRAASPCLLCGYNGSPTGAHRWNCPSEAIVRMPPPRSVVHAEAVAKWEGNDDEEDEGLPF